MANQITGEKKYTVNFVDILLIILITVIIAVAIVTVVKANPENSASGDKDLTYTITLSQISPQIAEQIKTGDTIYDNNTNQNLGTVHAVEIFPINAFQNDTEITLADKVDLKITISSPVTEKTSAYFIGNYRLTGGASIDFHSDKYILTGICHTVNS